MQNRGGELVAIVTDAGSPGISDPAYRVVCAAIEAGISVIPIQELLRSSQV
ncbi:MAG: hypothetical protein IPG76_22010 [Acidobacteria bacterium]|nr:hypothetical protein [Acidobacteriota bacterium]